jgi:hypothetical protein
MAGETEESIKNLVKGAARRAQILCFNIRTRGCIIKVGPTTNETGFQ